MFNNRAQTVDTKSGTRRDRIVKNPSNYNKLNNLNKSSTASKKTRPQTYGNKSLLNSSAKVRSMSNIHSKRRSESKSKLGAVKDRRSRSRSRSRSHSRARDHNKSKVQEVLITKTYDLSLKISERPETASGKDSKNQGTNKKISYVNKDTKE